MPVAWTQRLREFFVQRPTHRMFFLVLLSLAIPLGVIFVVLRILSDQTAPPSCSPASGDFWRIVNDSVYSCVLTSLEPTEDNKNCGNKTVQLQFDVLLLIDMHPKKDVVTLLAPRCVNQSEVQNVTDSLSQRNQSGLSCGYVESCSNSKEQFLTFVQLSQGSLSDVFTRIGVFVFIMVFVLHLAWILVLIRRPLRRRSPSPDELKRSQVRSEKLREAVQSYSLTLPPIEVDSAREEENCSICLGSLGGSNLGRLPCQHNFHMSCLGEWIVKGEGRTCPLCGFDMRRLLKPEDRGDFEDSESFVADTQQLPVHQEPGETNELDSGEPQESQRDQEQPCQNYDRPMIPQTAMQSSQESQRDQEQPYQYYDGPTIPQIPIQRSERRNQTHDTIIPISEAPS
uniref:RING-type domain-containing protein n=1 Tax=Compsopogon caeruleus TaxID=31354 RepID=A0A7S1TCZ1_9RHOD|mmetsp:Transcript_17948/g.37222  ORF Transcript_17948/g.37222 Transcript_17948/m.37222 type:complete len:398 (+) Transcript_17948:480-1673(+)